jgi:hypothetical protein
MEHKVLIPGLDRFLCAKCKKWICNPGEIERLRQVMEKARQKKTKEALYMELNKEERLAKTCQ